MGLMCALFGHKYKMFHKRKFVKNGNGLKSEMVPRYKCKRCGKVSKLL